jgi:hypothetical protein
MSHFFIFSSLDFQNSRIKTENQGSNKLNLRIWSIHMERIGARIATLPEARSRNLELFPDAILMCGLLVSLAGVAATAVLAVRTATPRWFCATLGSSSGTSTLIALSALCMTRSWMPIHLYREQNDRYVALNREHSEQIGRLGGEVDTLQAANKQQADLLRQSQVTAAQHQEIAEQRQAQLEEAQAQLEEMSRIIESGGQMLARLEGTGQTLGTTADRLEAARSGVMSGAASVQTSAEVLRTQMDRMNAAVDHARQQQALAELATREVMAEKERLVVAVREAQEAAVKVREGAAAMLLGVRQQEDATKELGSSVQGVKEAGTQLTGVLGGFREIAGKLEQHSAMMDEVRTLTTAIQAVVSPQREPETPERQGSMHRRAQSMSAGGAGAGAGSGEVPMHQRALSMSAGAALASGQGPMHQGPMHQRAQSMSAAAAAESSQGLSFQGFDLLDFAPQGAGPAETAGAGPTTPQRPQRPPRPLLRQGSTPMSAPSPAPRSDDSKGSGAPGVARQLSMSLQGAGGAGGAGAS